MLISGHKCLQRECLKSNFKNISILRANEIKGKKPKAYTLSPFLRGFLLNYYPHHPVDRSTRQAPMETPGTSAGEVALRTADVMLSTGRHTAPLLHEGPRPQAAVCARGHCPGTGSSRVPPHLRHSTCPRRAGSGLLTDRLSPQAQRQLWPTPETSSPMEAEGPERAQKARLVPNGAPAIREAAPRHAWRR